MTVRTSLPADDRYSAQLSSPAAQLRERWRDVSRASGTIERACWQVPAVDALATALVTHRPEAELLAACAGLGSERAASGVYIDEARHDLTIALELGGQDRSTQLAALDRHTVAWIDRWLSSAFESSCFDPLTQLATPAYLIGRLTEVRAEAIRTHTRLADSHELVVLTVDYADTAIEREATMVLVHNLLRSVFQGGETLARLGPTSAAVLVHGRDGLDVLTDSLARHGELAGRTRCWVETLPDELDQLRHLIHRLAF